MTLTYPGESEQYRSARERLLEREVELRRAMEDVAAARRELPPDGAEADVRLSELFAPGRDSLVIYHFMFPRDPGDDRPGAPDGPCPSCVAFLDQLDGAADHAGQRINLVIVAKAPLPRLLAVAEERGWRRLRLVSSAGTSFNRDYHAETPEGSQRPMVNVFHRDGGAIRHFWGSELFYAPTDPGQDPRHTGTIEPLWNLFDLTPQGRAEDFDEQLDYDCH
jgi:predicted dithiol-disulfide oxidoreductase (DUF899 family)